MAVLEFKIYLTGATCSPGGNLGLNSSFYAPSLYYVAGCQTNFWFYTIELTNGTTKVSFDPKITVQADMTKITAWYVNVCGTPTPGHQYVTFSAFSYSQKQVYAGSPISQVKPAAALYAPNMVETTKGKVEVTVADTMGLEVFTDFQPNPPAWGTISGKTISILQGAYSAIVVGYDKPPGRLYSTPEAVAWPVEFYEWGMVPPGTIWELARWLRTHNPGPPTGPPWGPPEPPYPPMADTGRPVGRDPNDPRDAPMEGPGNEDG